MPLSIRRWRASMPLAALLALMFSSLGCRSAGEVAEERVWEPTTGRVYRIVERQVSPSEIGVSDVPPRARAREVGTQRVGRGGFQQRERPVLLVLHPYAYAAEQVVRAYRLRERAVLERDWILVVPEGEQDREGHQFWNASAACCGAERGGPDDVGFLRAVLDDVARRRRVDAARVFVLGVSNGGFLAHRFCCEASERVRAFVSVAGAGPGPQDAPCRPERPVSVLHVHGARDATIRYAGGTARNARYPGARGSIAPWLRFAGGSMTRRSDVLHWFGPRVEIETHRFPSHRVELWTVPEGDHGLSALRHAVPSLLDFLELAASE